MNFLKILRFLLISIWGFIDIQKFVYWIRIWWYRNSLKLTDLPDDVTMLIIDKFPTDDRFKIRNVCQDLRRVADHDAIRYKSIELQFTAFCVNLKLDNLSEQYNKKDYKRRPEDYAAHFKVSFQKLKFILRVPTLKLDNLCFQEIPPPVNSGGYILEELVEPALDDLKKHLMSLPFMLSVKQLTVSYFSIAFLHQLLPHFKPNILELIEVFDLKSKKNVNEKQELLREISEMAQWKQAKTLSFHCQNEYQFFPIYWEIAQAFVEAPQIPDEEEFQIIEKVIELLNPNQTLNLFAGGFRKIFWNRLSKQPELEVIAMEFPPEPDVTFENYSFEDDVTDLRGYIVIWKKLISSN